MLMTKGTEYVSQEGNNTNTRASAADAAVIRKCVARTRERERGSLSQGKGKISRQPQDNAPSDSGVEAKRRGVLFMGQTRTPLCPNPIFSDRKKWSQTKLRPRPTACLQTLQVLRCCGCRTCRCFSGFPKQTYLEFRRTQLERQDFDLFSIPLTRQWKISRLGILIYISWTLYISTFASIFNQ